MSQQPQESVKNPIEAHAVLGLATEPGVRLGRWDYVRVQQSLELLAPLVRRWADEQNDPKPIAPPKDSP